METSTNRHVVVSVSGGMDSSTVLLKALATYDTVTAISFDYGQKHRVELKRAQELVDYLNQKPELASKLTYRVIKLDGLVDLLHSTLVQGGSEVPEGYYAEENQKETVVPNRNKIFSSITQAIALSKVGITGDDCDIALGIHAGDFACYRDCRQEFRDIDEQAFREGNWNAERVSYWTPYLLVTKVEILKDGLELCKELGLDFNEVYKRTNTSYKPYPSGNSDYKSASSIERILAFTEIGIADPVQYEDETGLVSWEIASAHAKEIEDEFLAEQAGHGRDCHI